MSEAHNSITASARGLELQDQLASLSIETKSAAGTAFAGQWLEWDSGMPTLIVRLTSDHSLVTLRSVTADLDAAVEFVVDKSSHRLDELLRAAESVTEAQHTDGVGVASYIDERTNQVVFEVDQHEKYARTDLTERASSTGVPFRVETSDGVVLTENTGGRYLTSCTSGFTVKHSDGRKGFLTAGHCGNSQSWRTGPSGAWNPTTYVAQAWNASRDVQWHSISPASTVHSSFYVNSSGVRGQTGVQAPVSGAQVCKWGTRSATYGCGTINSLTYKPGSCGSSGGSCNSVFIRVNIGTLLSCKGDSGGPWFSGNKSVGIHNGSGPYASSTDNCSSGSSRWAYFTSMNGALTAGFGVQLNTTGG